MAGPPTDPPTGELPAPLAPAREDRAAALTRATALMSVGTGLSRLTGFGRIAVMAWAIGGAESKVPDTYNLANSMPNIVYQLVIGEILATVFVPVFVEAIAKRSREEASRIASSVMSVALAAAGVFSAITILLAPWIIKIYTFRLEGTERVLQEQTGAFLLRLLMPQMIFYAVGAVMTGLLNAHRRFAAPMFAPILNNVVVMATFVAFRARHGAGTPTLESLDAFDKLLLGGGTTLGVIAMTVVLWPWVRRLPGRYSLRETDWRHPAIRHVGNLAKYSFGYVIVNQIGLWLVYALANGVQGGVTAYQSSWILYQLPYGIVAVSVMTALVPALAEHHVRGDVDAVRRDVSLGLRTTAFVILPAAAGFVALSQPIIRVLLEHGVFGGRSTELFADTFVLMAVGLGAYAAFQQIMRAFYAMQDTRTPLLVNVAAVGANVVTAIPLFRAMGVPGLALSHAISYVTGAAAGGWILRRRLGGIDGGRMLASHVRIGAASVATGALAWWVARAVGDRVDLGEFGGQVLQVGTAVAAGGLLYVVLSLALRVDEFRPLVRMVSGRSARRPA